MARQNKTRDGILAQKKGVCVAVIPFVEADVVAEAGDGSVYVNMPPRSLIMSVTSRQPTTSTTATSTLDVVANDVVLVNELDCSTSDDAVAVETLVAAARYLATGGELVIKAGAVPPAAGDLVGELIVEYIELDKNTGEYTLHLDS